jgi:hypothetical protein
MASAGAEPLAVQVVVREVKDFAWSHKTLKTPGEGAANKDTPLYGAAADQPPSPPPRHPVMCNCWLCGRPRSGLSGAAIMEYAQHLVSPRIAFARILSRNAGPSRAIRAGPAKLTCRAGEINRSGVAKILAHWRDHAGLGVRSVMLEAGRSAISHRHPAAVTHKARGRSWARQARPLLTTHSCFHYN